MLENKYRIFKYKKEIIKAVNEHQVVIIQGYSGIGKSTQIPQYILEAGLNNEYCIGITQTQESDVISTSTKVCQESGYTLGNLVGYQTLSLNKFGISTKVRYMTDTVLFDLCISDIDLSEFGIMIIEDIHVGSVKTEVLLGLIKPIMNKRKSLKIIVTTAATNVERVSKYFDNAPFIYIKSDLRKVSQIYQPISDKNYFKRNFEIIIKINEGSKPGDILLFLASEEEIESFYKYLPNVENLVFLSMIDLQQEILASNVINKRNVIVVTNESVNAFNVDSVRFVIDNGIVKDRFYDRELCYNILNTKNISKLQCDLRKNIAGRFEKGLNYRIYRKEEYDNFTEESFPYINFRTFSETYLKMLALKCDPMFFEFFDPIDLDLLKDCKQYLVALDLIDETNNLTEKGVFVKNLPLEVTEGLTLWWSQYYNCSRDIIIIMSLMKVNDVFIFSKNQSAEEQSCRSSFFDEDGDHFTRLNVYKRFLENKTKDWCISNFLNFKVLMEADGMVKKLMETMHLPLDFTTPCEKQNVKSAIIKVFFKNICIRVCSGSYKRFYKDDMVYINQHSVLLKENCALILYNEILLTQKPFIYGIMKLDEAILKDFLDEMTVINYTPYTNTIKVSNNSSATSTLCKNKNLKMKHSAKCKPKQNKKNFAESNNKSLQYGNVDGNVILDVSTEDFDCGEHTYEDYDDGEDSYDYENNYDDGEDSYDYENNYDVGEDSYDDDVYDYIF